MQVDCSLYSIVELVVIFRGLSSLDVGCADRRAMSSFTTNPSVSDYKTFLTKFDQVCRKKIATFSTQDKFIIKIYSIIDLIKLI